MAKDRWLDTKHNVDKYQVQTSRVDIRETHAENNLNVDPNIDPMVDIRRRVEHKYKYRSEEQGVYHSIHHQTMKMRNNGMLDFFVDEDTGLRIDPRTHSISTFGNHLKNNIHDMTNWLSGTNKWYVTEDWIAKIYGNYDRWVKGDIKVETEKNYNLIVHKNATILVKENANIHVMGNVKSQIDGNHDANVKGHAKINVKGDVELKTKSNMLIEATQNLTIRVGGDFNVYV